MITQADKKQNDANIQLASSTQVSEGDVAAEKAKSQGGLEAEVRAWIDAVRGEPLEGDLPDVLKSGVVLCGLIRTSQYPSPHKKPTNEALQ